MGYTLQIGKKVLDEEYKKDLYNELVEDGCTFEEAEEQSSRIAIKVLDEKIDTAPAFGEPTDNLNERWPSYSAWSLFTSVTDTEFLFYEKSGEFRGGHPGYFQITKEWLLDLKHYSERFKNRYPECIASYDTELDSANITIKYDTKGNTVPANFMICRLEWLEYWAEYALSKYGEDAIFSNT
jgi:hypothetical protein